jgi:hypothetical protein
LLELQDRLVDLLRRAGRFGHEKKSVEKGGALLGWRRR